MPKEKDKKVQDTVSCGTCLYRPSSRGGFEVLLVRPHKDRDRWGIPKGHVDLGETVEACAVRETFEETGLTPILGEVLPDVRVNHALERKTVKSFLATVDHRIPPGLRDGENFEVAWHHYEDLPPLHRYQVSLLAAAVFILKTK